MIYPEPPSLDDHFREYFARYADFHFICGPAKKIGWLGEVEIDGLFYAHPLGLSSEEWIGEIRDRVFAESGPIVRMTMTRNVKARKDTYDEIDRDEHFQKVCAAIRALKKRMLKRREHEAACWGYRARDTVGVSICLS